MADSPWQRWKRVAHRAAEIQAFVVLTIVYWAIVVPIGTLQNAFGKRPGGIGWKTRPPADAVPIEDARRQS